MPERRLLLDTHALIWWWAGDPSLPERVRRSFGEDGTDVYVSSICALEIAIKVRSGRLPQMAERIADFDRGVREDGFHHLDVRYDHAVGAGLLGGDHRDPFDRVIAAQGLVEDIPIVTRDPAFARFGCKVLW